LLEEAEDCNCLQQVDLPQIRPYLTLQEYQKALVLNHTHQSDGSPNLYHPDVYLIWYQCLKTAHYKMTALLHSKEKYSREYQLQIRTYDNHNHLIDTLTFASWSENQRLFRSGSLFVDKLQGDTLVSQHTKRLGKHSSDSQEIYQVTTTGRFVKQQ
jgi:hypothetical protein